MSRRRTMVASAAALMLTCAVSAVAQIPSSRELAGSTDNALGAGSDFWLWVLTNLDEPHSVQGFAGQRPSSDIDLASAILFDAATQPSDASFSATTGTTLIPSCGVFGCESGAQPLAFEISNPPAGPQRDPPLINSVEQSVFVTPPGSAIDNRGDDSPGPGPSSESGSFVESSNGTLEPQSANGDVVLAPPTDQDISSTTDGGEVIAPLVRDAPVFASPEPQTIALVATGLGALALMVRRRRRSA